MYRLRYDKILLWGFIWILAVSMVDHYLAIKLQSVMLDFEWNPLGVLLIEIDGGSVALFMTIKMAFLWVIAALILKLYDYKKSYAYVAIATLSFVQLLLILFFLCG
tara:strand:+ start:865 stop:1182 length:318 start_codon:yes stop_codon:yes gene_type:complete